jgi:hypothetical protein
MKVYAISGLGADERVFVDLELDVDLKCELVHLNWIKPLKNESITSYALRLSKGIDQSEEYGILGLSFGGLVTVEISKVLKPKFTILLSSVEVRLELPSLFRLAGNIGILKLIPSAFFHIPIFVATWLFGTQKRELLNLILKDADLKFYKWSINELVSWKNTSRLKNCFKIEGEKDKLLPPTGDERSVVIKGGQHLMIMDKAEEISALVNNIVRKLH